MAQLKYFPIGTDAKITLTGLADENGSYLTGSATVVGALTTAKGDAVTNGGSISFAYVNPSNGNFVGTIPSNAVMVPGQHRLTITVTYSGKQLTIVLKRPADYVTA